MGKSILFTIFMISFLIGVFVGNFVYENEMTKLCFLLLLSGFFLVRAVDLRKVDVRFLFILICLGLMMGALRFFISFDGGRFEEGYTEVKGCVVREVDVRNDKVKYVIDVENLGNVLVSADRYPVYEFGDCLTVAGELEVPEALEDFEYDKYLARYDIYYVMYRGRVLEVEKGSGGSFYRMIFILKEIFEGRLMQVYAEPHSSFMAGLILGSRKGIPAHLMEDFNTTGLTHIIAISGYNITLVIVIVGGLFSFLSRRKKVIASVIFIVIFVILVGASSAVVRAGIMGVISLMALWMGRKYYVGVALVMAAFLMNLWNPKILVYDVGFQLSFLATCGLIYVSPLIEKYFLWVPKHFEIRESVLMTLSAQILALPIIIYNFGRLSLISPIANLFVLPLIPFSMIFGFLAVMVSFVWEFFGVVVGAFGYLLLELIILFVKIFASIKLASISMEYFPWWFIGVYYFFILKKIFRIQKSD